MLRPFLVAATISVTFTSPSVAGPDETTRHFMNEPLSLLDWGIYRIGEMLDGEGKTPAGWARYDFDSNRIIVTSLSLEASPDASTDELSEICKQWIDSVRLVAFINNETGEAMLGEYSQFADKFAHEGYIVGDEEENTKRLVDLDKKIDLQYVVSDGNYQALLECDAPLLGTGFSIKDLRP